MKKMRIEALEEMVFKDVMLTIPEQEALKWLAGWETEVLLNIVSAFSKLRGNISFDEFATNLIEKGCMIDELFGIMSLDEIEEDWQLRTGQKMSDNIRKVFSRFCQK